MKVLTFSRHFPAGHPRHGEPTNFVEKVWNSFRREDFSLPDRFAPWVKKFPFLGEEYLKAIRKASITDCKHHTIRAGSRFIPGDMASLRVWLDKPYRSKQIEFAQVEVKKVWSITMIVDDIFNPIYSGDILIPTCQLAKNDGLECDDFVKWFMIHPKRTGTIFAGQVICWSDSIEYGNPSLLTENKANDPA